MNPPIYGKDESKVKPGLYLGLFHGAKTIKERKALGDAGTPGSDGPMIGPLKYVHTTYGAHIKLAFVDDADATLYGFAPNEVIHITIPGKDSRKHGVTYEAECINYNGVNYGDWTVYTVGTAKSMFHSLIKSLVLDAVKNWNWKNLTWDERKKILELAEKLNLISLIPKKLREQTAKMYPFEK